jgi:osmoprotectant transport system substrate-binding protein
MRFRRSLAMTLALAGLLLGAACANNTNAGSPGKGSSSSSSGGGSKGTVTISGQNFTELAIMAEMYKQVLEHLGYTVDVKLVETRDVYVKQLESGAVDIAPEYVAGLGDYLNILKNGPNAKPISSNNVQAALAVLKPLATKAGITMLQPAKATDQNAFAVTKKFAAQHHLKTLSDLAAMHKPIVLAAAPDCQGRSDCEGGLSKVYGLNITKILSLGYDSPQTKDSVLKGESQLGEVATTDGALSQEGLVILADNKGIQPAQNLIPAVNSAFLKAHPDVGTALNKLSAALTTSDLAALNTKVSVNRQQPADVARQFLSSKGLI